MRTPKEALLNPMPTDEWHDPVFDELREIDTVDDTSVELWIYGEVDRGRRISLTHKSFRRLHANAVLVSSPNREDN